MRSGSTLDSARIKCDLGSSSGSLSLPGQPVVGESQCIGKEGFLHSRRDSLCRPQGGFPSSDSPNFLVEGVGGWVSLEEGLPQHAFKGGLMELTRVKCG